MVDPDTIKYKQADSTNRGETETDGKNVELWWVSARQRERWSCEPIYPGFSVLFCTPGDRPKFLPR